MNLALSKHCFIIEQWFPTLFGLTYPHRSSNTPFINQPCSKLNRWILGISSVLTQDCLIQQHHTRPVLVGLDLCPYVNLPRLSSFVIRRKEKEKKKTCEKLSSNSNVVLHPNILIESKMHMVAKLNIDTMSALPP